MASRLTVSERFWAKVQVAGPHECWLWTASRSPKGYGRIRVERRSLFAHRVALDVAGRPVPDDAIVLHSCDTPACVNPAHLRVGTPAENSADMVNRGRAPRVRSTANGRTVFPDQVIARALELHRLGFSRAEIAAVTRISPSYVSRLVRRERRDYVAV